MRRIAAYLRQNTLALIALCLVIGGGTAWAATKIGSKDIRDGAVKSRDIGDRAVKRGDLGNNAVGTDQAAPVPRAVASTNDPQEIQSGTDQSSGGSFDPVDFSTIDASPPSAFQTGQDFITVEEPGVYVIDAEVHWPANPAGDRFLRLDLLRGTDVTFPALDQRAAATDAMTSSIATTLELEANDTVLIEASQSSGAPIQLTSLEGQTAELTVQYLSPTP